MEKDFTKPDAPAEETAQTVGAALAEDTSAQMPDTAAESSDTEIITPDAETPDAETPDAETPDAAEAPDEAETPDEAQTSAGDADDEADGAVVCRRKPKKATVVTALLVAAALIAVSDVSFLAGKRQGRKEAGVLQNAGEPATAAAEQEAVDETGAAGEPETAEEPGTANDTETEPSAPAETEAPQEGTSQEPAPIVQKFDGVFVYGNAAYEYYRFSQAAADSYAAAINTAAEKLKGKATVYDMLIPTSTGIALDRKVREEISDDQKKAIAYIEGSLSPDVKRVSIYDALMEHRDEYLYFRTDHHWTGLAAYYAYREFCAVKGIDPVELEDCKKQTFDNFLGTFYNETRGNPALGKTPDYVDTYTPPGNYEMDIPNLGVVDAPMIYDESNASSGVKYGAFICGDNAITEIEDTEKKTGETCLIIKESFGNALVPVVAGSYKTTYVMDYRYYTGDLVSLVEEKGIDDVIFANNVSMARAQVLIDQLIQRIGS
ncbi:MAG: hypothetical protein IJK02_04785 [Clostridia bacterium]|nr:hypothetical protein [Clostridia bacterium]